jgi:plastocyanin
VLVGHLAAPFVKLVSTRAQSPLNRSALDMGRARRDNTAGTSDWEGVLVAAPASSLGVQRAVWTVAVLVFLALAIGGPVQIVRAQAEKDKAEKASKAAPTSDATGPATVKMVSISFQPGELAVRKGTEVIFENEDVAPHTVTAVGGGAIDSGTLGPRKVFRLVVNEPFEYVCLIHPSMKGKIVFSG